MMKFHRQEKGVYISHCQRVVIQKVISKQTHYPDEVCWSITIDGKELPFCQDTKKDAILEAERRLKDEVL